MSVLFVIAGSLTKTPGGTVDFDRTATIAAAVPAHAERLATRREEVRRHVMGGEAAEWQGIVLKDLPYNQGLARGADFGGERYLRYRRYLPAADRYRGRFFQAVEGAETAWERTEGNTVIVSGLYGLVTLSEPIQLYSCWLSAAVADIWQRDTLLTDILRAYIGQTGTLRVFDLTAMEAYRSLIDWDAIAGDGTDILHGYDTMAAGNSALTALGRLFGYLLSLTDYELIDLDLCDGPRPEFGTSRLYRHGERPDACPSEVWRVDEAPEVIGGGNPDVRPWRFAMSPRFRRSCRRRDLQKIVDAVAEICRAPMVPRADTIQHLSDEGGGQYWLYRRGGLRLVYEPDPNARVVRLLRFAPRWDVYKGLRKAPPHARRTYS